jgi:hypothetical protein
LFSLVCTSTEQRSGKCPVPISPNVPCYWLYPEYPFIVELNIPSHSAAILITAAKDIAEQKEANLTFRIRYACRDCDAKQHWSHNGTFCALARRYVIAGPQTVLTMSLLANRRARFAKDIFPAKPSPDWHQNDETRHELEKLYAEWGLDIRWLRGERSHVRAAPSRKKTPAAGQVAPGEADV